MREKYFIKRRREEEGKSSCVCARKRGGRGIGGQGATNEEVRHRVRRANGKTVYGKRKGGNRGPGAKVERKQVDNDRFQSNQHNQQNIPQIPQPFRICTSHDLPTFQEAQTPTTIF